MSKFATSFAFAALTSAALSCTMLTSVHAAEALSTADIFYNAKIEKCLALGTLTSQQLSTLADEDLKAFLRTCDKQAVDPPPAPARVAVPVAPVSEPSSGTSSGTDDGPRFGPGRRFRGGVFGYRGDDGAQNPGGGGAQNPGGGGGIFGNRGDDGAQNPGGGAQNPGGGGAQNPGGGGAQNPGGGGAQNPGGGGAQNPGGGGAQNPGGGGAPAVKLTNIQKDAIIGDALKPGEARASARSKDIGNGLKEITQTAVTKNADGSVTVVQNKRVVNAAGVQVGTPQNTNERFTPADVAVLKQADSKAGNAKSAGVAANKNANGFAAAKQQQKTKALDKTKQASITNVQQQKTKALDKTKQASITNDKPKTAATANKTARPAKVSSTGKTEVKRKTPVTNQTVASKPAVKPTPPKKSVNQTAKTQ